MAIRYFLSILAVASLTARHRSHCTDGSPSTLQGDDEWDLNRCWLCCSDSIVVESLSRTADTILAVDRHPGESTAQYLHWASKVRFQSDVALAKV
jgi:hypothetical protein